MSEFLWTSGHLGWAFFALMVFSGLWLLAIDMAWRLTRLGVRVLVVLALAGWVIGVVLILWGLPVAL